MPDALIGVIVGGLIAWVAPLLTLSYNERRWRFEAKMNHLKAERDKRQQLYEKNLQLFAEGAQVNRYSSDMITDMAILMPKEVNDIFEAYMEDTDKSDVKIKHAYADLALAMKRDLAARDEEIRAALAQ